MRNTKISIDRLNIRLKGVSAPEARESLKDLGGELLKQLAQRQELRGTGTAKIGTVDAGIVQAGGNAGGPGLQRHIAARLADTIGLHLNKNKRK
jgi:hypothetical protein